MKILLFVALLIIGTINLHAQKQVSIKDFNIFDSTHIVTAQTKDSLTDALLGTLPAQDTAVAKMQKNYPQFTIDYRMKVFNWQYYSTIIIFFIVIAIVLAGLYISYLQFKAVFEGAKATAAAPPNTGIEAKYLDGMGTNLKMGNDGIKIHSGVVGPIILTLSVLFFFLYIKYIYNITIVH